MHLGIDLGGTKIEIIALAADSRVLLRQRIPSPQGDYQNTLQAISTLVAKTEQKLVQQGDSNTGNKPGSLGIGIPGSLSIKTGLVKNANSTWLIGKPLKLDLESRLKRPVVIANDADCFTLSETHDGAAAGYHSVFGVILGTGVGGGFVINGQLLKGPNTIVGEWGHNPLPWQTEHDLALQCYCGKQACIETFVSGPGLSRQFELRLGHTTRSNQFSPEKIMALYRDGNHDAIEQLNLYIDQLSRALASVINIIDPEIIVFGGGLSNINELYQQLPEQALKYVFSDTLNTRFVKAMHGDSSGVRGAAWLGSHLHKKDT